MTPAGTKTNRMSCIRNVQNDYFHFLMLLILSISKYLIMIRELDGPDNS